MTDLHGAEGIEFLDHTADVGIDVHAPSLELLFHRAAIGMLLLLQGRDEAAEAENTDVSDGADGLGAADDPESAGALEGPTGIETRTVELEAEGAASLLAEWLKELLFLHETRHADYGRATFDRLGEEVLEARIQTEPAAPAVREIKGVTYHELTVERTDRGWYGRVIFDV